MKILVISQLYPGYAGQPPAEVSYALHHLIRPWVNSHQVLVIRPFLVPALSGEDRRLYPGSFTLDGVQVLTRPVIKIPGTRLFCLWGLGRRLEKMGFYPQVVVAHLGYSLLFGQVLAGRFHVPLISAVHYGDLLYSGKMLGKKRLARIFREAAGIACRSAPVEKEFLALYPDLEKRCFLAYSGIDAGLAAGEAFATDKLSAWKGVNDAKIEIISVCSLLKLKNIDINLRALSRLPGDISWHYTIIGDGPERPGLESLAGTLGILDKVRFLGLKPREQALAEMGKAHIFLLVSAPETFGLVYLEALAKGCLVIGAVGYGIDGVIADGKNGFLCRPRDEGHLLATLEKIICRLERQDLERVVVNAQATLADYTEERAAQNYLDRIKEFSLGGAK